RSEMVADVVLAVEQGTSVSDELYDAVLGEAVDVEVERQNRIGIDVVSDGEFSKITYASYVQHRLTGFSGTSPPPPPADLDAFPVAAELSRRRRPPTSKFQRPTCTGPVGVRTRAPLENDIRRMLAAVEKHKPNGAFLTAASPGLIAIFHPTRFYPTHAAYLEAPATASRVEYQAI